MDKIFIKIMLEIRSRTQILLRTLSVLTLDERIHSRKSISFQLFPGNSKGTLNTKNHKTLKPT